jgi:hypothetical protein
MEIELNVFSEKETEVFELKDFICEHIIMDDIYVKRLPEKEGTLGIGGITSSLVAIIEASAKPLTALVECLNTYISLYKTDIEISTGKKKVKLSSKNPQKLEPLVKTLLELLESNKND